MIDFSNQGPFIKDVYTFSVIFDPSLPSPHYYTFRCPPFPPVCADTNFEYDTEFFSKIPHPNIYFYHPSYYTNTKNVSHEVKYLLKTLMKIKK